jgi:hypothetical protein
MNLLHERIHKLYSFWSLSRPVVTSLPSILTRLRDLQSIHQSAASITKRVSGMSQIFSKKKKIYTMPNIDHYSFHFFLILNLQT